MNKEITGPFIKEIVQITDKPPGRGYIFLEGLGILDGVEGAERFMYEVLGTGRYRMLSKDKSHVTMMVYGDEDRGKVIETWFYNVSGEWPGNLIRSPWVFERGEKESIYHLNHSQDPKEGVRTILDLEESFRQKTKSLEEYMGSKIPDNIHELVITDDYSKSF